MKGLTYILNATFCLTILLFLCDGLTPFDIKNQGIKSSVYLSIFVGSPLMLIWNLFAAQTKSRKLLWSGLPALMLVFIFWIGPLKICFSAGAWRTQAILYRNENSSFRTVEFQMQDVGALGYNARTVEVLYLTPLFMLTYAVPDDLEKRPEWVKTDIYINELHLKFP